MAWGRCPAVAEVTTPAPGPDLTKRRASVDITITITTITTTITDITIIPTDGSNNLNSNNFNSCQSRQVGMKNPHAGSVLMTSPLPFKPWLHPTALATAPTT